ncbi:LOW QUALITY PROTEIN: tumor necrosis factor receptor superfamily member 1A [Myiozetetes cayanensis]|uniref:LOW QUALITY PROTEIN: tumor necrosis factor receptor superfamily member 1A n=1 Tax=Myiozetetes cayanensis TaxID=478635 RepID=UPI00215E6132|nr:LOW QUALITY PROTEIN: tumor necrosis factor receptor superfamily member 1A [Myiozetetes cayanensis]
MRAPALPRTSLGTVILTFICVLTKESVEITPVPYTLQVHRVALDGRDPSNPLRKEKKQVHCQLDQYLHPRKTHCCMRCHAGTYKARDCDRPDQAPVCLPCANGTFTAVDNIMSKCFQCTRCRTELQQIVEAPCTPKQDTVCGCLKNQYHFGSEPDLFQCRNCSSCDNGIIASCSKDRDTICRCKPQFFLSRSNICKPCNSCTGEECLQCHSPVTTPPTSSELSGTLVLGILVAIFGVISILYIVNKVGKLVQENRIVSSFYSCVSLPQTTKEPVPEVEVKRNEVSFLLPESKKEIELPVNATPSAPLPQSSHELPDCVRPARKTQLPDNPAILYTVVDHVPPSRWKEFVRRLGLSDYDLERIELDHRRLRDAQYEMLRLWKLQMGRAATVEHISSVLNQMELSGCSDAIQEALLNQNSPQPCNLHNHL